MVVVDISELTPCNPCADAASSYSNATQTTNRVKRERTEFILALTDETCDLKCTVLSTYVNIILR